MTETTPPAGWRPMRIDGLIGLIGPLLRPDPRDDTPRYALQTDARHANALGVIHGGTLTALLDQAIALLAWEAAERQPTVTVQMDTRFLDAARPGDLLIARPRIRRQTRSLLFLDAELTVGDRPVADATAVMKIHRQTGAAR
ncbi:PaaI family thioesterase [Pseudooceanicola marinus]|uniref:PaaI family thioesterase n=1 Tax=Pseudooceanicola marinus TaxID=396013 RepID=UPI001CD1A0D0|nr:PaaI family thioesterase [Pseudooceanicola marinus]MCA1337113.1 PaaI family thioesterase [Pseudooceanicola marinus]